MSEEETVGNIPCKKCGRTDLPLHYNGLCPNCYSDAEMLDEATDELAEALADFDAEISPEDEEAYECMRRHVEDAQIKLLEISKSYKV